MIGICHLRNTIQPYAWGSRTELAELLGQPTPSATPQAELWMGAHPMAPSRLEDQGRLARLDQLIELHPDEILGRRVARRFENRLPFLFKVLAAAQPLSIQAHPDASQARSGFEGEARSGVPPRSPQRNYRDPYHKPEIVSPLGPFWALYGFRPEDETRSLLEQAGLTSLLAPSGSRPLDLGLKAFFSHLMTLEEGLGRRVIDQARTAADRHRGAAAFDWLRRLGDLYPQDVAILAPLFLNLVELEPGQALFLGPGVLHSYLGGLTVELMANSDNVLRGGLTDKHVDVDELLRVVSFVPTPVELRTPQVRPAGSPTADERVYPTAAEEFALSIIVVRDTTPYESLEDRSVELLFLSDGEARLTDLGTGIETRSRRGDSFLVPAHVRRYRMVGNATVYKAFVP